MLCGYACDEEVHTTRCWACWAKMYIEELENTCYAALRNKTAWKVMVRSVLGKERLKRMTEENKD